LFCYEGIGTIFADFTLAIAYNKSKLPRFHQNE